MASFTNTIRNKIFPYGGAATLPLWNSVTWNAFKWGQGADVLTTPTHLISTSLIASAVVSSKLLEIGKVLQNSISPTTDASYETLMDGNGYSYIFPSDTANAGNRAVSTYSSGALQGTSYTSLAAGSAVWS